MNGIGTSGTATGPVAPPRVAHVRWHGEFFVHHSLALVNRRLAGGLAGLPEFDVEVSQSGKAAFNPGKAGDESAALLAAARRQRRKTPADLEITHVWPPILKSPGPGHWVVFQPWEFGSMPAEWIRAFRDRADDVWVYANVNRSAYVDDGVDPERVHVIRLGVDSSFSSDAPPHPRIVNATKKSFRFLFVGGTIHRKGIDVLLQAWVKAFRRTDDVCLVIKDFCRDNAYKGQTFHEGIRKVQAMPDAGEIVYIDDDMPLCELPSLYTACHMLVHPYRGEGFALPVAESMACGLTPIVTRGGSTDDFCSEGTAVFIPSDRRTMTTPMQTVGPAWTLEPSIDHLAALLKLAAHHRPRMREMGQRASAHVRANLTWDAAAKNVAERLSFVLSRPRRPKE